MLAHRPMAASTRCRRSARGSPWPQTWQHDTKVVTTQSVSAVQRASGVPAAGGATEASGAVVLAEVETLAAAVSPGAFVAALGTSLRGARGSAGVAQASRRGRNQDAAVRMPPSVEARGLRGKPGSKARVLNPPP